MPYNFVPDSFHTGAMAEALRAKMGHKSTISHQRGHFESKFQVQPVAPPPPIIFARLVRPMNALQVCRWQFHTGVTAEALRPKTNRKSAISLQCD